MTISDQIKEALASRLRPENARREGYLGMSAIGGCPTVAYDSFYGNRMVDMRLLWYGFSGGAYESKIYDLLALSAESVVLPKSHYAYHIEADFDSRYRGHADIILVGPGRGPVTTVSTVVDVKSLAWSKFEDIILFGKMPYSHDKSAAQVQS